MNGGRRVKRTAEGKERRKKGGRSGWRKKELKREREIIIIATISILVYLLECGCMRAWVIIHSVSHYNTLIFCLFVGLPPLGPLAYFSVDSSLYTSNN